MARARGAAECDRRCELQVFPAADRRWIVRYEIEARRYFMRDATWRGFNYQLLDSVQVTGCLLVGRVWRASERLIESGPVFSAFRSTEAAAAITRGGSGKH